MRAGTTAARKAVIEPFLNRAHVGPRSTTGGRLRRVGHLSCCRLVREAHRARTFGMIRPGATYNRVEA
ncbi:hypothetical protein BCL76_101102 [Streptomyces sp. CG 926]|nr:hypothetical protein BCL76_101102 [Streptomyces sp. CG 926]